MAEPADDLQELKRRIGEMEILVQALSDAPHPGVQIFQQLFSRIDRLQSALTQQQQAFQDFMISYNADQQVATKPQITVPEQSLVATPVEQPKKAIQDACTQTPLAQAPAQAPPPPPPVRIRQARPDNRPSQPSPLSRSSSLDKRPTLVSPKLQPQHSLGKSGVSPKVRTPLHPLSTQTTPTAETAKPKTPLSAKAKGLDTAQKKVGFSVPSNDPDLKARRAAFAALQSAAPQQRAAKPSTALAMAAAQRQLEREAARHKAEAERERCVFLILFL